MAPLIYLFLFFILFRFILRYVLPIFHITRQATNQMRQMQDRIRQTDAANESAVPPRSPRRAKEGEYIDYEEIK